ncbi:MAG: amidohydrolase family protein, partial [Methylomonas sp.]|nr:amidohydrolase family protein [Methylomonas sp.]
MNIRTFPRTMLRLALLAGLAANCFAEDKTLLIHAARIFDGYTMHDDASVLITDNKITGLGKDDTFSAIEATRVDLGDATLLPGLIELHAHLNFRHVPADAVLRHGITTLRDVGGPLHAPYGGDGSLRVMTSGPIITAPEGYPIPSLGQADIAVAVRDEEQARQTVRNLVAGGAVLIKVALEPGGEIGAPWSGGHAHGHSHGNHDDRKAWPLLPENVVKAIVDEAHRLGRKVSAHLAESKGARIALNAGIDEWAHTPCAALPDDLLKQAAVQRVKIVSTIDTLAKCPGVTA